MRLSKLLLLFLLGTLASAQTFINLVNLAPADGRPYKLVQGSDGNLYGATESLVTDLVSASVVFKLTPAGVLSAIYSFYPVLVSSLIQGSDGNLYGTTSTNSSYKGTVFRLS